MPLDPTSRQPQNTLRHSGSNPPYDSLIQEDAAAPSIYIEGFGQISTAQALGGEEGERLLVFLKQRDAEIRRIERQTVFQTPIQDRLPLVIAHVYMAPSERRISAALAFRNALTSPHWLKVLGEFWTLFDNIRYYRLGLKKILGREGPPREMMDFAENAQYDGLPDTVPCYRGYDASVRVGASWSLSKETAKQFPFLSRYRVPNPVLITATVKKSKVLAVKLCREEEELITFSARRVTVETLERVGA